MKQYLAVIQSTALFQGIEPRRLEELLHCLEASKRKLEKAEIVLLTGDKPEWIGLVLEGQLHIEREDIEGRRSLVARLEPGELFAEALCCAGAEESPVTVCAAEDAQVLLLRFDRLLHTCPKTCAHHEQLLHNMLRILARKNMYLQGRMELLGIRALRERILRYLSGMVQDKGKTFAIPFNREELADYLGAERTALSHELSRMKQDGLLDYWKNQFVLR